MIRLLLFIIFITVSVKIGLVAQNKYLPEDIIESALEKAVEIGGDTVDALSLVYEMHKPTEED